MANKKINQLVSKTAILSTDLFGIGDATTGQLFKKTIAELQAAIGGAVISVNGLVGTVVLDTDDIQELATPTNKYFTDARARGAISLTVTGNSGASTYSSGTGVLNVPTYTLAGLGGITASFLSGTSGISYNSTTGVISYSGTVYTDSSIRALLSGGTGISYNSSTGAISYSGTVYTDSSVRALISLTTTGTSGASTYNNTTGVINVPEYTLAGLGGISLTSLSGGTGITYNSSTGAISYSGTVYTDASVRALISASGAVSYNNTTGVISLTSGNLTEATSSVLTITGGTGAVLGSGTSIQVKQATTSVSGFLSSTDWNTFNGKASALSGTTGYHAKFTSSTAIGNSIIYDDGTNVGIGTTAPATAKLHIAATTIPRIRLTNDTTGHLETDGLLIGVNSSQEGFLFNYENTALYFGTFSTERMRITSGGNVGIGTTTPQTLSAGTSKFLDISNISSGGTAGLTMHAQTGGQEFSIHHTNGVYIDVVGHSTASNNFMQFRVASASSTYTSYVDAMRITSGGNIGIGTTSPVANDGDSKTFQIGSRLVVQNVVGTQFLIGTNAYYDGTSWKYIAAAKAQTVRGTGESGSIQFSLHPTGTAGGTMSNMDGSDIKMIILPSSNVAIGTITDNGYKLYVSGTIYATGNITANSDLTLKKNLTIIDNPTDKLMQLNGYAYQWKEDDSHQYGVIAQEVEKILPYAVSTGNDGIKGVSYNQIIPVLIEAVKEQKAKIENLEILLASK